MSPVKIPKNNIKPIDSGVSKIYQPGHSAEKDAWFTTFIIENHLDYFSYPDQAASDEQVRFMVYTEENERYYPCSDRMFAAIMHRNDSAFIQKQYAMVLEKLLGLIDAQIEDPWERDYLEALIANKYQHETRDEIAIPSRLEKRLMRIYLNRTHIEDPYREEKTSRNKQAHSILSSQALQSALNYIDPKALNKPPATLKNIKTMVAAVEFSRLLCLANSAHLWETKQAEAYKLEDYLKVFGKKIEGNGWPQLLSSMGFDKDGTFHRQKILWLMDEAGQTILDLAVIRFLVSHGHKVIIALKEGPLFTKTDIDDLQNDPILEQAIGGASVIRNPQLSKNELVRTLRGDIPILALSDGTRENLNLLLVSTTFSRMFKEVDLVITRGPDQRRRFFETHFQFTQDIFNITSQENHTISILFKPRHPEVIKFSHHDLEQKADTIVDQMKAAKHKGMTVIFYSGIIGSIPGKIRVAKTIMSTFVDHLKRQSAMTFIINPSEYYEPGMDADDLMYMWEIVQRSGFIDIWRFQTYEDIVIAFQDIKQKVPPEWVGKDATYSTGCTKEMEIALDVQLNHPEMQIIGPAKGKFTRRKDYGVGKMYDQRLGNNLC